MNTAKYIFSSTTAISFLFTSIFVSAQSSHAQPIDFPEITSQNAKLPITFSWVNFDDPSDEMPPVVEKKIKKVIVDFYLESNGGDSSDVAKAKDYYFNTLCVPLNNMQLYIVILKTPLSYSHCKLFLYDTASNKVSAKTVDYNTWSMYSIDENVMKRSELLKSLQLKSDDIVIKKTNLLLKRLKHIGQTNELEEFTYRPNGTSLDSVSFKAAVVERPN